MFRLFRVVMVVAFLTVLLPAAAYAQGPVISSTVDIASEVTGMMDLLVPYWQWILLAGLAVTAGFGLVRRAARFLR